MAIFGTRSVGWAGLAAAGSLALLAACTVVVDEEPGPGPQFCTQQYDPVCARRGDERRTFSNRCFADRAGFRVVRRGECVRDEEPRFCTREYRPVCARSGGAFRTFGNACEAEAAGWRIVDNGPC